MKPNYKTFAVIFLDILGTKDRTLFEDKFAVHRVFHEEIQNNEARKDENSGVIHTRTLRSFSDCVFVLYSYKDGIADHRKDDLNLLYIALYNTSLSIIRIMNAGFLVRGGASLGNAFIDELGFFGSAVEEAHELESNKKKAIYPRVILDEKVGERLYDWERSKEMNSVASILFDSPPRLIHKDKDGWYFLNVFYQLEASGSVQFAEGAVTLDSVKAAVEGTILKSEEKHHADERIMKKMEWMREFTSNATLKTKPGISPILTFVSGPK